MYNSTNDTFKHIENVRELISKLSKELNKRALEHDESKLYSPEKEIFDKYTPLLKGVTYGSEEYKKYLKEMNVALQHHYSENRHHPEHFKDNKEYYCSGCGAIFNKHQIANDFELAEGHLQCEYLSGSPKPSILYRNTLKGMDLIDLIEMISDWKAATMRHDDGDILKSLDINQKRFGYSNELKQILLNTLKYFE
jgi:hypothetical protein